MPETFSNDPDSQTIHIGVEGGQIVTCFDAVGLAWVVTVATGDDREHQCGIVDRACDRAEMVDCSLDGKCPGIRDEPERRLVSDDAAECRRDPDRPALIPADGKIDVTVCDESRTATG